MKRVVTILIVVSFVAISVFGFIGVEFMTSHHEACIVSTVHGGMCPEASAPLDYINFHMNALKSFSTAVFGYSSALGALLLVSILALAAAFKLVAPGFADTNLAIARFGAELAKPSSPLTRRLLRWLSLCENSPAFS